MIGKIYSKEEKKSILDEFRKSGMSRCAFAVAKYKSQYQSYQKRENKFYQFRELKFYIELLILSILLIISFILYESPVILKTYE